MAYSEFLRWVAYRNKRGSFNLGMRVEAGAALNATMFANANSKHGSFKQSDFMPHAEEEPVSLDDAMESWT